MTKAETVNNNNKPLSANVKLRWPSLSRGHCLLLDMLTTPKWLPLQNHSLTLERTKMLVVASALLRLNKCKLNSSPVASLFCRWKSLGHCYQIGRLSLPVWLPKSRPSRDFIHLKYYQTIVYSVSKKTVPLIKFTILGNLNISVKVRLNVIIGIMFI